MLDELTIVLQSCTVFNLTRNSQLLAPSLSSRPTFRNNQRWPGLKLIRSLP
jgi:hypothetical protein